MKKKAQNKKMYLSRSSKEKHHPLLLFYFVHKETILLSLICSIIFLSHTLYVLKTYQYPAWDEHLFLQYMIKFYDIYTHPSWDLLKRIGDVISDRQPVYPLSITFPLLFFGTVHAYKWALWVNGLYYIVTIISVYFLAKEFISKQTSLVAAVLFACYGFPLFYLHFVYSETAATAFVALSLCFLAKSQRFFNRKYTVLFSIAVGLASLTRWTTPIFIIGPLIFSFILGLYTVLYKKQHYRIEFIKNILLFFIFSIIFPAVIYYLPKFSYFKFYVTHTSANSAYWVSTINYLSPELTDTFSVRSIMFYFNILSQQTIYLFIIFLLGVLVSIFYVRKYAFLLIAFFIPYCFFTFVTVFKDDRFIVLIYPSMAIISAVLLAEVKNTIIRRTIIAVVLVISVLNLLGGSWGIGPLGKQGLKDIVLPSFIHHPRRVYLTTMVWPPQKDVMNGQLFVKTIEDDYQKHTTPTNILMTFRDIQFDQMYSIYTYEKRNAFNLSFQQIRGLKDHDYGNMFKSIQNADYIAIKNKHNTEPRFDDPMLVRFNRAISFSNSQLPSSFVLLKTLTVPYDKSQIKIYKRVGKVSKEQISIFSQFFIHSFPEDEDTITSSVNQL